jgi:hypothetical protein
MISPVDRDDLRDDNDVDDEQRPPWLKWYCSKWALATQMMDAEQKGWYMNLLMHAANQGKPAGYLLDDDEKLRDIAGLKGLAANAEQENRRWAGVREKFRKSKDYPGLLYNKMLSSTIKEASRKSEFTSRAAKLMQAKRREQKELLANAEQMQSRRTADLEIEKERDRKTREKKPREKKDNKELVVGLTIDEPDELVLTPPETNGRPTKNRKQPETLFDEEKFIITAFMKQHLFEKYPELDNGDLEWMRDKFCNVYHNRRYASWSRCFYNFVLNQLTKYDYQPGSYNWRRTQGGKNVSATKKPWESAADRNSRLEQEAAEYTRKLRGGGVGDTSVDSPGLTLGAVRDD